MIRFDRVSVRYDEAPEPVLRDVDLVVDEGELCVVVGPTGSGKTTLLRSVNGLVPHFSGGTLSGRVEVDGRSTADHHPRDLADVVGFVVQDPRSGFVAGTVEDELAFSMESLGLDAAVMRRRVEETLDLLGLEPLRDRDVGTLSGGEAQRTAIGAALTATPRVLVLDEPTSALDPGAAEDVLAALHRLVHDLGVTVLMAEHRLERVVSFADRIVHLGGGTIRSGPPGTVLAESPLAPPVVQLGRLAGWDPLPVDIRSARRAATDLRDRIGPPPDPLPMEGAVALTADRVTVVHDGTPAVRGVSLTIRAGERIVVMGRNGSGKSSLLWALQGTGRRDGGDVSVDRCDPATMPPGERRQLVGLVPQEPEDLLYHPTVDEECAQGDDDAGADPGTCRSILDRLVAGIPGDRHPRRDLSEGQRLSLVLAITLTAAPPVLLLDEPTRGLDQIAKDHLATALADLAADGRAVVVATHDVEFAAHAADRVVILAGGDIVSDGPAADVLGSSPLFAPQVAKIVAPAAALTVDDVRERLR